MPDDNDKDNSPWLDAETAEKTAEHDVDTYAVECPCCDNVMMKSSTGSYYPRTHKCSECGEWLWHWPEKYTNMSIAGETKTI